MAIYTINRIPCTEEEFNKAINTSENIKFVMSENNKALFTTPTTTEFNFCFESNKTKTNDLLNECDKYQKENGRKDNALSENFGSPFIQDKAKELAGIIDDEQFSFPANSNFDITNPWRHIEKELIKKYPESYHFYKSTEKEMYQTTDPCNNDKTDRQLYPQNGYKVYYLDGTKIDFMQGFWRGKVTKQQFENILNINFAHNNPVFESIHGKKYYYDTNGNEGFKYETPSEYNPEYYKDFPVHALEELLKTSIPTEVKAAIKDELEKRAIKDQEITKEDVEKAKKSVVSNKLLIHPLDYKCFPPPSIIKGNTSTLEATWNLQDFILHTDEEGQIAMITRNSDQQTFKLDEKVENGYITNFRLTENNLMVEIDKLFEISYLGLLESSSVEEPQKYTIQCLYGSKVYYNNTEYESSTGLFYLDFTQSELDKFCKENQQRGYNLIISNPDMDNITIGYFGNQCGQMQAGRKETEGKVDYSEINLELLDLMGKRFSANKDKYPSGNSKKPMDINNLLQAVLRHTRKMIQPLKDDSETFEDHLAAVACGMSMILDQINLQDKK